MNTGKTGKYFKYAIGEIVLVVIGILIALSITNWDEQQKLDSKTQDYYVQLLDDLSSGDVGLIPSNIRNRLIDLRRQQNLTINRADWVADGKNDILQN